MIPAVSRPATLTPVAVARAPTICAVAATCLRRAPLLDMNTRDPRPATPTTPTPVAPAPTPRRPAPVVRTGLRAGPYEFL